MVALRIPIHVSPFALLVLLAATDTLLGNAYLDCLAPLRQAVRLLAVALVALAFALADDSFAIGSPTCTRRFVGHPSLNTYHPLHLRFTRATLNQRHEANFVVFTVCEKTTSPSKHSRESRRLRGRVRRRPFLTGWPTCEELSCGSNTLQASSSSSSPAGAAFASLPLSSPILQHVQRHVQLRSVQLPALV